MPGRAPGLEIEKKEAITIDKILTKYLINST